MRKSLAIFLWAAFAVFAADARAVTIAWSPVGNSGNSPDTTVMATDGTTGYGSVAYNYNIGTYDVTNSQYAEFLNAKNPTGADPLGLYNSNMSSAIYFGGISYNAAAANGSKYTVISGDGNHPVNNVTWYDTLRFSNWLNNGQGNSSTETGAYTLLGGTPTPSNANTITRNTGATVFLPNENEWYKAAFYNSSTGSYFQYPTSSNTQPTRSSPTALPNSANYFSGGSLGNLTDVGAYTGTTSPSGAFDMGGDIVQWNETLIRGGPDRGLRDASFEDNWNVLLSSYRNWQSPGFENAFIGFRVASIPTGYIPEPSTGVMAVIAIAMMWWWRKRF